MQYVPLTLASAAAVALLVAPAADAQRRDQIMVAQAEQTSPLANPSLVLPPNYGAYALQSVYPVCRVRREQFQDSYGWRVRDVVICN
jgi:hypothetical protein